MEVSDDEIVRMAMEELQQELIAEGICTTGISYFGKINFHALSYIFMQEFYSGLLGYSFIHFMLFLVMCSFSLVSCTLLYFLTLSLEKSWPL